MQRVRASGKWRGVIIAGMSIGIALIAIGYIAFYAITYHPLKLAETAIVIARPNGVPDNGAITIQNIGTLGHVYDVRVREPGSRIQFMLTLENTGRFAVQVTRIDPLWSAAATPVSRIITLPYGGSPTASAVALKEVMIEPGQLRRFILYLDVNDCVINGPRSYRATAEVVNLSYAFHGISSTVSLPLATRYSLVGAPSCVAR